MKNLFLFLVLVSVTVSSCSKKDEPVVVPVNPANVSCFLDSYNGTYSGVDGNLPLEPTVVVKLTKTGCETCTLESAILGNLTVSSIAASSGGGFAGKLSDGSPVSLALEGTKLTVTCTGYAFGGNK